MNLPSEYATTSIAAKFARPSGGVSIRPSPAAAASETRPAGHGAARGNAIGTEISEAQHAERGTLAQVRVRPDQVRRPDLDLQREGEREGDDHVDGVGRRSREPAMYDRTDAGRRAPPT